MRILLTIAFAALIGTSALAAEKPLYKSNNAAISARIRATFTDADPFAGAKVVGQMFADQIDMGGGKTTAKEAILDGLVKESVSFRKMMPDFRIEERDVFVADNGVVMTGRMIGTRENGQKMDTAFVTVFNRDTSGKIVSQATYEVPRKQPAAP